MGSFETYVNDYTWRRNGNLRQYFERRPCSDRTHMPQATGRTSCWKRIAQCCDGLLHAWLWSTWQIWFTCDTAVCLLHRSVKRYHVTIFLYTWDHMNPQNQSIRPKGWVLSKLLKMSEYAWRWTKHWSITGVPTCHDWTDDECMEP